MNNRILLRIAAMDDDTDNIDTEDSNDDDLQFDFDSLFNTSEAPKSDIEKMVTEPISTDIDTFDPK